MKKSIKKTVKRLERYIGHDIIRIRPTLKPEDHSYTDIPLTLLGFTSKGEMKVRYTKGSFEERTFGSEAFRLPLYFTDYMWISYKKALKAKGNPLNKWKGKKIKRIVPTSTGDHSYMCREAVSKPPTLLSASKHHVRVRNNNCGLEGRERILRFYYAKASEWELAE